MKPIGPIVVWRNQKQMYRLCGCQCVACKKSYYPKKYLCDCGSQEFCEKEFCGKGTLLTFTKTSLALFGIVALDEGVRVLAQIVDTDFDKLYLGMPVRSVFRKLHEEGEAGVIVYGIKFAPTKG